MVLLKCYQRLGYFPKLTDVPAIVVDHVRGKLDLADDVNAEADAERTGKRHRPSPARPPRQRATTAPTPPLLGHAPR
ncbi:hypothetical protein ACWDKQ_26100 [Saccharopolyspora sp. NPDC000995]